MARDHLPSERVNTEPRCPTPTYKFSLLPGLKHIEASAEEAAICFLANPPKQYTRGRREEHLQSLLPNHRLQRTGFSAGTNQQGSWIWGVFGGTRGSFLDFIERHRSRSRREGDPRDCTDVWDLDCFKPTSSRTLKPITVISSLNISSSR